MSPKTWAILVAMAASGFVAEGAAQTFDVKNLDITQGSIEIGSDNSIIARPSPSQNRSVHDQSVDYGVREWWRLSAVMKLENPARDDLQTSRVALESIFVLRPMKPGQVQDVGIGFFAALEGAIHEDTTNALVIGPIVTARWEAITFAFNPFLEQTFGRNRADGIALSYGWQAKYDVRQGLAIGIEGFGLIDNLADAAGLADQEHRIGPVVYTEISLWGLNLTPDIGVLFGLTSSTPDVTFKINVGVPLR
jgi:hypothetical protein